MGMHVLRSGTNALTSKNLAKKERRLHPEPGRWWSKQIQLIQDEDSKNLRCPRTNCCQRGRKVTSSFRKGVGVRAARLMPTVLVFLVEAYPPSLRISMEFSQFSASIPGSTRYLGHFGNKTYAMASTRQPGSIYSRITLFLG